MLATLRIRAGTWRESGGASGSTGYLIRAPSRGMRLPSVTRIGMWVLGRVGRLWSQLAPRRSASEIAGAAVDAVRSRRELIIENAVLRHQVTDLRRRSKRPKLHLVDRLKLLTTWTLARATTNKPRPRSSGR